MPRRIAKSTLQASTLDIMNAIRQNASYDYQQSVPVVAKASDIPKVGEVICGTPAFANQYMNALVNRIALVMTKSATFNNPYASLKKGYLEFGETVEEIFVQIANVVDYTPEKGAAREFKRTLPDVKSAFHTMNWRVMYPVTIQDEDLRLAFLAESGVHDLVAKIVDSVYKAAEYDEFLLFKYLLIKAVSHGKMFPMSIGTGTDLKEAGATFRGASNDLTFMQTKYNASGVRTNTPREHQAIFMDSWFNAKYDVAVLAAAFNMDKATYTGALHLIDDWTSFDNERFDVIRKNSDGLEEVTSEELASMQNVKAVLVDTEWFQIYDNNAKFTEQYCASGMYWNYFYHVWKTISSSPFSNAIVFVTDEAEIAPKPSYTVKLTGKDTSDVATVFTLGVQDATATLVQGTYQFKQTKQATTDGIAILPYGAIMIPASSADKPVTLTMGINGVEYTADTVINSASKVSDTVTMTKNA
nr:MAG TPA: Head protein [Caudoviricetes sp.]